MRRRLRHWQEVSKRATIAAGWTAGVVTALVGGSVLAASGFLLHYHHRATAVSVVAAGAIVAVMEGSYRVWDASDKNLASARARLSELDTAEAKRAYIDQAAAEGARIKAEIESDEFADEMAWRLNRVRLNQDTNHWEDKVRATLRQSFKPGLDRFFDSEEGLLTQEHLSYTLRSRESASTYLERRLTRLTQIRERL